MDVSPEGTVIEAEVEEGAVQGDEMTQLKKRYNDVCMDLNMDKESAEEAWSSFIRIRTNYTLEGDKMHWLACSLYVSCRKGVVPTVGSNTATFQGNGVSLTRLLRSCKLSLVQFFQKMKLWVDMGTLSLEMRKKVDSLERNFNVTTVIFKKYRDIFKHIFQDPIHSPSKPRARKQPRGGQPPLPLDVFNFCWTVFIHVKSQYSAISDDLVNSYHMLLTVVDLSFGNALVADNGKDLVHPSMHSVTTTSPSDTVPCILTLLCNKWAGITVEAKGIKEHWTKPAIKRMVEKKQLKARSTNPFLGFLDPANFEVNRKNLDKEYDQYVLNLGDFDERIFLCENADAELGCNSGELTAESLEATLSAKASMKQHMEETRTLTPMTPLSNRHFLKNRENVTITPVSNATATVSQLQQLLIDRTDGPSPEMLKLFSSSRPDVILIIQQRVTEMGERFVEAYSNASGDHPPQPNEFAQNRLKLAVTLYYKVFENILTRERKNISSTQPGRALDICKNEIYSLSLFACCCEIVLFSYNSKRTFPWIIDVCFHSFKDYKFQASSMYKVIEPLIREEEGLSRSVVKHLNFIEEQTLESLAWKSGSNLWDQLDNIKDIPSYEDVSLPAIVRTGRHPYMENGNYQVAIPSTIPHAESDMFLSPTHPVSGLVNVALSTTPVHQGQGDGAITATSPSGAKRRLFEIQSASALKQGQPDGDQATDGVVSNGPGCPPSPRTVKRAAWVGIFFRKVYHMAWTRLKDLCDRLRIGEGNLIQKIWTCFESTLRFHTRLMMDRHLDQLLMCAIYCMCKVTETDVSFSNIMDHYRNQPQAKSFIYRGVFIQWKKRKSTTDQPNGSVSPTNGQDGIRSNSTLPCSNPSSSPATPTGDGSFPYGDDDEMETGDLIKFYNIVYIPKMRDFILRFCRQSEDGSPLPPLSPLPKNQPYASSPNLPRRISRNHPVFVSPLRVSKNFPPSPSRPMSYSLFRSPSKDFREINQMLRSSQEKKVSKRIFQDEVDYTTPTSSATSPGVGSSPGLGLGGSGIKKLRPTEDPVFIKSKITNIMNERGSAVAAAAASTGTPSPHPSSSPSKGRKE